MDQILQERKWGDLGEELDRRQKEMNSIATEIQRNTEESQKKQIDRRDKENDRKRYLEKFNMGEKVWLYDHTRAKRKGGSLAGRYRGPFKVVDVNKSGNLKLEIENGVILVGWQKPQFVKKYIESMFAILFSCSDNS